MTAIASFMVQVDVYHDLRGSQPSSSLLKMWQPYESEHQRILIKLKDTASPPWLRTSHSASAWATTLSL